MIKLPPPVNGEIAIVNLQVEVVFRHSDKIVSDYDEESGYIEYTSGMIMDILPNQSFVYKGESRYIKALAYYEKTKDNI